MAAKSEHANAAGDREIIITREFNAPRELVWETWTDPKHLEQWWGPRGFTTRVTEMDFRVGGRSRYVMVGPDGTEYPVGGVFKEIVPPERIVSTDEFEEGFEAPGFELPSGIILTATFEDLGGRTRLTLHIAHPTAEDRRKHEEMGVVAGWNSSFDCLDDHLAELQGVAAPAKGLSEETADRELSATRIFDAPRDLVFRMFTDPKHITHWWGPRGFSTTTHSHDLRPGGVWRFVMHGPDGTDYPNLITYLEVEAPSRLAYKHGGSADAEPVNFHVRVLFDHEDGKTRLSMHMLFPSASARDYVIRKYGADQGLVETLDRLGELLARQ